MSFEAGYALGAALLWAVSSLVINTGLKGLRGGNQAAGPAVVTGVLASLAVGSLALGIAAGGHLPAATLDPNVILGGLLTFPIGTGLYYFAAVAYQGRAEVSSQYANVKPALSIAFGALLFGEAFGRVELLACLVIGAGIVVIVGDALRRRGGLVPAALGLMLAASWAGGEAFIRAATDTHSTLEISFGALVSSLALTGAAVGCYLLTGVVAPDQIRYALADFAPRRAHGAFCLHGLLSFGAAYSLLFHSIGLVGLSHTIMITVFWPTLALGLGAGLAKHRGATYHLPGALVGALALFTSASVVYVASQVLG